MCLHSYTEERVKRRTEEREREETERKKPSKKKVKREERCTPPLHVPDMSPRPLFVLALLPHTHTFLPQVTFLELQAVSHLNICFYIQRQEHDG